MTLKIDPIPAFTDNYFWALQSGTHCAVVDPGDAEPVIAWLAERGLSLVTILITHHHGDHVGGIEKLRRRYGDIPVYGPAHENIPERTHAVGEGAQVDVFGTLFQVWEIPGHTAGHIAYVSAREAFVGDTMFAAGCGRLFEGTPAQMAHSLGRIAALPPTTNIYCAHEYTLSNLRFALSVDGENEALVARAFEAEALRERGVPTVPFTIAQERATNPFLRAGEPALREAANGYAGQMHGSDVDVFATLRQMKNEFR
jgi:hydroxyacylglutathione hydrolase